MKTFTAIVVSAIVGLAHGLASTDTITWGGDNTRAGYFNNHNMDPAVVGSSEFGQVFKTKLPGTYVGAPEQIFSQPLVYTTSDGKQYVYWATSQNNIYKMDAKTGEIVAQRNLHIPFLTADLDGCVDINPCIGVTATGVIDPATGTWYLTAKTYLNQNGGQAPQGRPAGRYYVHAINVNDLSERPNFPVDLEGLTATNNPTRMFTGGIHHQRPGLLQHGQFIYAGFASHCVQYNFTGWIIGWDKSSGKIVERWATQGDGVPNNIQGAGIWMSGGGLASDDRGSMFFATGNGYASQLANIPVNGFTPPTAMEEAACHMTINSDGSLTLVDFFMPWEKQALDGADKDLGTSPLEILPSQFSCGDVRRMGVVTGKSGKTYWLNLDNLGGYRNGPDQKDKVIQTYQNENSVYAGAGVYPLEGGYIYINVIQYPSHVFKFSCTNGVASFTKVADTPVSNAYILGVSHGTVTSLNGQEGTGLLWISDVQNTNFRIYNAVPKGGTMSLVKSFTIPGITKFTRPVFGDGMVYLGTTLGFVYGYGSTTKSPLNCTSPVDFGNVDISETSVEKTITCKAMSDVSVSKIALADNTNYAISGLPTVPLALTTGKTFTMKATFSPKSVGRLAGDIIVNTTTADTTYSAGSHVLLSGVGQSVDGILSVSPKSITFSGIVVGQKAEPETVLLNNDGSSDLRITSVQYSTESVTGPFQNWTGNGTLTVAKFTLSNIPTTVAGGQSSAVSIDFDTKQASSSEAFIKFSSNGGSGTLSISGTAGGAPVALLEFQTPDGTGWVTYKSGTPFTFGDVTQNTNRALKFRVTNNAAEGGVKLSLTVSKPPFGVAGLIRANNQVDLAEGTLLAPGESATAVLTCTVPKSQWNVDSYNGTAQWTMNTNDPNFDKQFIQFFCNAVSQQAPPLLSNGQGKYRYVGCFKENNPGRQLSDQLLDSNQMTNGACIQRCADKKNVFCGTQYHRECWGGNKIPKLKVDDRNCNYDCTGDLNQICGGNGYAEGEGGAYISLFADSTAWDGNYNSDVTPPGGPFVNPGLLGYTSIGCYTEATSGRALPDGRANSDQNVAGCLTACKAGRFLYAGLEYGGECWCGNEFTKGSVPADSAGCNMVCNGNATEYCGGPSRLNAYQLGGPSSSTTPTPSSTSQSLSTSSASISAGSSQAGDTTTLGSSSSASSSISTTSSSSAVSSTTRTTSSATPTQTGPVIDVKISAWDFQGCWTEATNIRALNQKTYAKDDMTLQSCATFCEGFDYFGAEYGRECYCGNQLNTGSVKADNQKDCSFKCAGSQFQFCGAGNRLQLYKKGSASTSSSSAMSSSSATSSSSFSNSTTSMSLATSSSSSNDFSTTSSTASSSSTTPSFATNNSTASSTSSTSSIVATMSTIATSSMMTITSTTLSKVTSSSTTSTSTKSTVSPTPSVWPGNSNFTYYACVSEPSSGRLLPSQPYNDGVNMTVENCLRKCWNFKWVGVEYGRECWCGDTLTLKGTLPGKNLTDSACDFRCPGDNLVLCGAGSKMNLYLNNVTNTAPKIVQRNMFDGAYRRRF